MESNGWTRDDLSTEGSGRRYHSHRNSQYFNARALVAETTTEVIYNGSGRTGLAFNVGTGYSGGTAWYKQAGTPKNNTSVWIIAGLDALAGAITAYHFFAHNSGDQIYVVVERTSGVYGYFGFGLFEKYGTLTGGDFMFGSGPGADVSIHKGFGFYQPTYGGLGSPSSTNYSVAAATVDVDAETGWHSSAVTPSIQSNVRRVIDLYHESQITGLYVSPNTLNSVSALQPVILYVFRDSDNTTSSPTTPIGEIPNIFYCSIKSLVPSQQITLGSEDYRVFPFTTKGSSHEDIGNNSGYIGFAIKE